MGKSIRIYPWSEWGDSNSRRLDPKSSALPTGPHPDIKFFVERVRKRRFRSSGQICGQTDFVSFANSQMLANAPFFSRFLTFGIGGRGPNH